MNHTRRGDAVYRKVAELARSGEVGELHSMMMLFPSRLMWIGTHGLDLMNFVAGDVPVRWVSGEIQEGGGRDPGGNAIFEYENGVRGFVNGFRDNPVGFRLHVIGSEGEIVVSRYDLTLWRNRPGSWMRYEPVVYPPQTLNYASPMVKLIEELVESIEGGPEPVSNGRTALRALEQIVGIHCSSRQDCRRVRVPDPGPRYRLAVEPSAIEACGPETGLQAPFGRRLRVTLEHDRDAKDTLVSSLSAREDCRRRARDPDEAWRCRELAHIRLPTTSVAPAPPVQGLWPPRCSVLAYAPVRARRGFSTMMRWNCSSSTPSSPSMPRSCVGMKSYPGPPYAL